MKRILLINTIILLSGILILELIFGTWLTSKNSLDGFGFIKDKKLEIDVNELYSRDLKIQYTRDKYGFRGEYIQNQPYKIKVLTIGGSTTDQRYIDDKETWQHYIEQDLLTLKPDFFIGNAGVDGQSSLGHLASFSEWFPKIQELKPEFILFYIGINDAFKLDSDKVNSFDNLKKGPGVVYHPPNRLINFNNSAFYSTFKRFQGQIKAEELKLGHLKLIFEDMSYTDKPLLDEDFYKTIYDTIMNRFSNRILQLIEYTRKMGATPVFITQPVNYYIIENDSVKGYDVELKYDNFTFNGLDAYNLLKQTSQTIKSTCADSIFVIDLFSDKSFNQSDFYDYVHMNPKGTKKLGKKIAHHFMMNYSSNL